jgi:hypothetical protein
MDKSKPKPKWLRSPPPPDAKKSYRIAWRYWSKLWDAIPPWAEREAIARIYREAHRQRSLGFKVHVDHSCPIRGELVCGLHCIDNLVILTERENYAKGNHIWPGMPLEPQQLDGLEVDPYQMQLL